MRRIGDRAKRTPPPLGEAEFDAAWAKLPKGESIDYRPCYTRIDAQTYRKTVWLNGVRYEWNTLVSPPDPKGVGSA